MLRNDPAYAAKAAKVSPWPATSPNIWRRSALRRRATPSGLTVAYHSACSLQHGQKRAPGTEGAARGLWLRGEGDCRRRICAAARPAPTTSCSRRSPGGCATARSSNIATTGARRDRRRQYRLHHADRVGHRDSGGAYGRADRLGDRRTGAGAMKGRVGGKETTKAKKATMAKKRKSEEGGRQGEESGGAGAPERQPRSRTRRVANIQAGKSAKPKRRVAKPKLPPRRSAQRSRPMTPPGPAVMPLTPGRRRSRRWCRAVSRPLAGWEELDRQAANLSTSFGAGRRREPGIQRPVFSTGFWITGFAPFGTTERLRELRKPARPIPPRPCAPAAGPGD